MLSFCHSVILSCNSVILSFCHLIILSFCHCHSVTTIISIYLQDDVGKFSHHISSCLDPSVTSVILDGEMCAWSKEARCLLQKSEQVEKRTETRTL